MFTSVLSGVLYVLTFYYIFVSIFLHISDTNIVPLLGVAHTRRQRPMKLAW